MDESDEDDVRRLPGLKTVKKKKLRMGIPVWLSCLALLVARHLPGLTKDPPERPMIMLYLNSLCWELLYEPFLNWDTKINFFFVLQSVMIFDACQHGTFRIIVGFKDVEKKKILSWTNKVVLFASEETISSDLQIGLSSGVVPDQVRWTNWPQTWCPLCLLSRVLLIPDGFLKELSSWCRLCQLCPFCLV